MLPIRSLRILAAAGVSVLAVFALPVLVPQFTSNQPVAQTSPTLSNQQAAPTQPIEPTAQPTPNAPPAQQPTMPPDEQVSALQLVVGKQACSLKPMTAEAGSDLATLSLGDDCQAVETHLRIPKGGTLWLNLMLSDQPDIWLPLKTVEGDAAPPDFDQRGRYFGCSQAQESEQVCQVTVTINAATYRVTVPLTAA